MLSKFAEIVLLLHLQLQYIVICFKKLIEKLLCCYECDRFVSITASNYLFLYVLGFVRQELYVTQCMQFGLQVQYTCTHPYDILIIVVSVSLIVIGDVLSSQFHIQFGTTAFRPQQAQRTHAQETKNRFFANVSLW